METPKIELLNQLNNCVDILLSHIHSDELRYNVKQMLLDDTVAVETGEKYKLVEQGYEMKGNIITLHYSATGKIAFDIERIAMVIAMVKKDFPNQTVQYEKKQFRQPPYRARNANDTMLNRETYAETEQAFTCAKQNLEEAVRVGNKKLIEVFKKQFDLEVECMRFARTIDYAAKARQSEFKQSGWEANFYNQFCKGESHTNYYALGFSPISCDEYFLLKEKDMLDPDLTYEEAVVICNFYKVGIPIGDYEQKALSYYTNREIALKAKFGRKDGNGYRKPKNNKEEYEMKKLENEMARAKFILAVMARIFAEEEILNVA